MSLSSHVDNGTAEVVLTVMQCRCRVMLARRCRGLPAMVLPM
jgi:hypothetical protein